jgi:hypothetical protein
MSRLKHLRSVTVHLRPVSLEAVDALAHQRSTSRGSVIRQAVEELLRRQGLAPETAVRAVTEPGIPMAHPRSGMAPRDPRAPDRGSVPAAYIKCGLCPEDAFPIARAQLPAHVAAHRAAFDRDFATVR